MTDILTTDGGDLVIGPNGDLAVAQSAQELSQIINFRLQTETGDYLPNPDGPWGDLGLLIGDQNTQRNADLLKAQVVSALTQDGLLGPGNLEVQVIPLAPGEVGIFLKVQEFFPELNGETLTLGTRFNYITGGTSPITARR